MAYSYVNYTLSGVIVNDFAVSIPYLEKDNIFVYVNDVETTYEWLTSGTIEVTGVTLVEGDVVQIRRITKKDDVEVKYQDGAAIMRSNLDKSNLQTLYIVQEAIDGLAGQLQLDGTGNYNAESKKITNVDTCTDDTDVANKLYVDTQDNALISTVETERLAAEAAKVASEAAQLASETAASNSVVAKEASDVAQVASEAAQAAAELARDEAVAARDAIPAAETILVDSDVGTVVQEFDVDTVKADVDSTLKAVFNNDFTSGATPTIVRNMGRVVLTGDTEFPDLTVEANKLAMYHWIITGNHTLSWNAAYTPPSIEYNGGAVASLVTLITDGTLKLIQVSNWEV